MDMHVNTDAFMSASASLKKHCKIIENMTTVFLKKLNDARGEFDDVNYERTVASATAVKGEIVRFSSKISTLEKDLKTLEDLVTNYLNGGYSG